MLPLLLALFPLPLLPALLLLLSKLSAPSVADSQPDAGAVAVDSSGRALGVTTQASPGEISVQVSPEEIVAGTIEMAVAGTPITIGSWGTGIGSDKIIGSRIMLVLGGATCC